MENTRLDSFEYEVLNYPYNRVASELSNVQRIVHGQNVYCTLGGKLAKRPGTLAIADTALTEICDRLFLYETLDSPPIVYVIGSFFNGSTWEVRYNNIDQSTGWITIPSYRQINSSTQPHELVIHRGLCFIKGYPQAVIKINCGGAQYIDATGHTWLQDRYYEGFNPGTASINVPGQAINMGGTIVDANQTVCQSARYPTVSPYGLAYNIPLSPGTYIVNLTFAEIGGATSGQRKFDIVMQGTTVQSAFDIEAAAGAQNKCITKTYTGIVVPAPSGPITPYLGELQILLDNPLSSSWVPIINAIEIVPATIETLGTVIFNGSNQQTEPWGALGPQVPAGVTSPGGWGASAQSVTVSYGWGYVYSYVTITGQVTNHSPLQNDPTLNPSFTGAFTNLVPQVQLTGLADTINFPYINVYRTTDGGGTFYLLQQVNNTGAGTITYYDNSLVSGGTTNTPLPDSSLDTSQVAPTLVSNSPPPAVLPPLVTGVDSVQHSSPVVTYAGRLWYAIGNYLFYSGLEEIAIGVPEECWPSGLTGNYFQFPYQIYNLISQAEGLLVITSQACYYILGTTKDTFTPQVFLSDVGTPPMQARAATVFNDQACFLTQDYRIALINQGNLSIVSDPLYDDLVTAITNGGQIGLTHWAQLDKDYLIINSFRRDNSTLSQQWIYDLKKSQILGLDFWFPPWTIQSTACASGRTQQFSNRYLLFWAWDGTTGQLVYMDPTAQTGTDALVATGATQFGFTFDTFVMTIPAGNHVNILSKPARVPCVEFLQLTRSMFTQDVYPVVGYFKDDLWSLPIPVPMPPERFPRNIAPQGFREEMYNIHDTMQKVAFRISQPASAALFELQRLLVAFDVAAGD